MNLFISQDHFKHGNIVIQDRKAIYFEVPKVCSTTIKKVIRNHLFPEELKKQRSSVHHRPYPSVVWSPLARVLYSSYFKFTFVRNPFDRLVSCFRDKIREPDVQGEYFCNGVAKTFTSRGYEGFYGGMHFSEFLEVIARIDDIGADPHIQSQYQLLHRRGFPPMDFIGRFERLEEDFVTLSQKVQLQFSVEAVSNSSERSSDYKEYYTARTRQIVEERYENDLRFYGYSFEGSK